MSAFPIVPRAGGARGGSSAPAGPFVMPTLDLGKISFASMGGSAAPVVLPENDDPYDVDSSDEDLDGMEAAVAMHEARRARREELDAARSANAKAPLGLVARRAFPRFITGRQRGARWVSPHK